MQEDDGGKCLSHPESNRSAEGNVESAGTGIPSTSVHLKMCQKFLFVFKSQGQFSCVFLQSSTLLHNKYFRVIFCRHRMYLQNSYIMIDTAPYRRRRRPHSSMGMCKDGLRYRSYHFQNWRPQI